MLIALLTLLTLGTQLAVPANPHDGRAWRAAAEAQLANGDAPGAIASLRKAIELGALSHADGLIEIAAAHAAAGDLDAASAALADAIAAGYRFRASIARDKRFAMLPADQLANAAGTARTAEPGTPEARRADVDFLVREIRRLHPRFASGDPAPFGDALRSLDQDLPRLTDTQFVIAVQRLLARAGDGHTLLYPFGMAQGALTRVAATLYWFDDGIFIVDAADPALRGARVTAIDGEPVASVLSRLRPLLSLENEMHFRWAAPLYLTFPAFTSPDAVQKPTSTWSVHAAGVDRNVVVSHGPVDPGSLETKLPAPARAPRFLARRAETAWFEAIQPRALYVQVNAIANGEHETLEAFARRLSTALRSGDWDAAIVDLRNNSGGDAALADALLKTLVSFDEQGGRLIVLTGRVTFSAAQTLAARLDAWTTAVFVGEPTGSRVNRYGNEAPFRLPHTGMRGTISSGWNQPVTSRDHRAWIAPDLPAVMPSSAYFAGEDPVLERALAELRRSR